MIENEQYHLTTTGRNFIQNPERGVNENLTTEYFRTVTEIYLLIHNQITEYPELWPWFEPIFRDSFIDYDIQPADTHPVRYRQQWRRMIGQDFREQGTHASTPFCTGDISMARSSGTSSPLVIIESERQNLINRNQSYVTLDPESEDLAPNPPEHLSLGLSALEYPEQYETVNEEGRNITRSNQQIGWLYILSHPMYEGWVKIGKTVNLAARLSSFNTGVPNQENHYQYEWTYPDSETPFENALELEQQIHRMHDYDRPTEQSREWYNWTVEEAREQIQEMADYDPQIPNLLRDAEVVD